MYKYETHLHTSPVSKCARATVRENLAYYKSLGYDGVFITNHFLDGNVNTTPDMSYEQGIAFYFSAYEEALDICEKIGIKVFCGVELTHRGTDFLVYGLDKEWFLSHPEIMKMNKKDELAFMMDAGALVIQAHPYREAGYIEYIRLFPRSVHGVETMNACRTELENKMADIYAENYNLIKFAGSDNHFGEKQLKLAGMCSNEPITDEKDFVEKVKSGKMQIFSHLH